MGEDRLEQAGRPCILSHPRRTRRFHPPVQRTPPGSHHCETCPGRPVGYGCTPDRDPSGPCRREAGRLVVARGQWPGVRGSGGRRAQWSLPFVLAEPEGRALVGGIPDGTSSTSGPPRGWSRLSAGPCPLATLVAALWATSSRSVISVMGRFQLLGWSRFGALHCFDFVTISHASTKSCWGKASGSLLVSAQRTSLSLCVCWWPWPKSSVPHLQILDSVSLHSDNVRDPAAGVVHRAPGLFSLDGDSSVVRGGSDGEVARKVELIHELPNMSYRFLAGMFGLQTIEVVRSAWHIIVKPEVLCCHGLGEWWYWVYLDEEVYVKNYSYLLIAGNFPISYLLIEKLANQATPHTVTAVKHFFAEPWKL